MNVISLDCESNGLGGRAFAAAAVLTDESGELDRWEDRCPIDGPVDSWVSANVLPALAGMPETSAGYGDLLHGWRGFYSYARAQLPHVLVVVHVLWPVEARFLLDAHADQPGAGPYPIDDVAGYLRAAGRDPTSVDRYLAAHGLPKPEGSPHHPLYDARAAERAFRHLMGHRVLIGPAS
jgi:hypothetical protein